MVLYRRGRFWYWFARELSQKYTRSLVLGLIAGLLASAAIWQFYPTLNSFWFKPIERVGMVGEFSPTNLPLVIQQKISSGLTQIAPDGSAAPALAQSWEATDSGKTFIFHLTKNYFWSSGKPVEASDVNYNIRNVTFTAPSPNTLKISLLSPYSPLPTLVAKPIFQSGLRGFGQYRVAAIRLKGDKVQYLKLLPVSDNQLKVYEYRFYRTETLALEAYKMGEIDILEDISNPQTITSWGKTTVSESRKYNRIVSIFFNLNEGLLKEKSFRQALAYGVPKLDAERAYSPLSKNSWAYTDKVRRYDPDPNQAQKFLTATKVATSAMELTLTTFSQYLETAQKIADNWNSLGIKTKVKVENFVPANWQILLTAQEIPPDPDQYPFWHSTQQQTNITGYVNVKIDKLLEDGRQELDTAERQKVYADFQRRLVEDAPVIFLYYPKSYTIRRGNQ